MRILIIDDSKAVHAFMNGIFAGSDHQMTHVYDGSEALALLKKEAATFDVILLDWEMPVMAGPETLVRIRESDADTPIIMVTTKNDLTSITTALEKGASEYVMKPFTKEILLDKIGSILGREVA